VCAKGIGKDHAKWSPVCTAWYRLLPEITINGDYFTGKKAKELKEVCPVGVFDVEDSAAVVAQPEKCTTCRLCIEKFGDAVQVGKVKNHFMYSVESTGAVPAPQLFLQAVALLKKKAKNSRDVLLSKREEKAE